MSIAAHIERVTDVPDGYELELTGTVYDQGDGSLVTAPPGQSRLTILDPTWRPEVGMSIYGGSGWVLVGPKPSRKYERIGYTRLREWQEPAR
jgi:hypothetical protein